MGNVKDSRSSSSDFLEVIDGGDTIEISEGHDGKPIYRGATGAARAPKPGKAPIMAARRRCRRRLLFFKIEVRPRPCRPYRVRRR